MDVDALGNSDGDNDREPVARALTPPPLPRGKDKTATQMYQKARFSRIVTLWTSEKL